MRESAVCAVTLCLPCFYNFQSPPFPLVFASIHRHYSVSSNGKFLWYRMVGAIITNQQSRRRTQIEIDHAAASDKRKYIYIYKEPLWRHPACNPDFGAAAVAVVHYHSSGCDLLGSKHTSRKCLHFFIIIDIFWSKKGFKKQKKMSHSWCSH